MSPAEVAEVVKYAASQGAELDEDYAEVILRARTLLQDNPEHREARIVIDNFKTYMLTGKRVHSFCEFMLGETP